MEIEKRIFVWKYYEKQVTLRGGHIQEGEVKEGN
jgi:hypothetical protein